jgi:hypothetical protein
MRAHYEICDPEERMGVKYGTGPFDRCPTRPGVGRGAHMYLLPPRSHSGALSHGAKSLLPPGKFSAASASVRVSESRSE